MDLVRVLTIAALGLATAAVAIDVALDPFDPAESKARARYLGQVVVNVSMALLAVAALLRASRLSGSLRAAVGIMALGLLGCGLSNSFWTHANHSAAEFPHSSLAHLGLLAMPLLTIVGVAIIIRASGRRLQGIDLALGVAVPLTVLIVFYAAIIQPRSDPGADQVRTLADLAYPTLDTVDLALAGILVYFTRQTATTRAVRPLAAAMALMALSDVLFMIAVDRGFYFTGSWVDLLYIVASTTFGLALLRFEPRPPGAAFHPPATTLGG